MRAWPRVPLKHVVDINRRVLPENTPPDTEFRYIDISTCGRGRLEAEPQSMRFADAPSRARRLVRQGDTIISTVRTYLRAVWPVAGPADDLVVSTGFAVLSPRGQLDPRFLGWVAQSDLVIAEIVARSVGVSYPAINGLEVGELQVPVPDLAVQRAIAEYLEAEAVRMDTLLAARSRQRELLRDHRQAFRDQLLADMPSTQRRLTHLLNGPISDGPHETPEFMDEGVPFLSVDNMVEDQLSFYGCRRISPQAHETYSRKSSPRRGDVLVTKAASVGRIALVETDEPFSVWSPLAILHPDPSVILPAFLREVLLGSEAQSSMRLAATSNTQENLSMRDLAALRVRVPDLGEQDRIVRASLAESERVASMQTVLARQIALLTERRQALVTAAVTGQFEIPGVAA